MRTNLKSKDEFKNLRTNLKSINSLKTIETISQSTNLLTFKLHNFFNWKEKDNFERRFYRLTIKNLFYFTIFYPIWISQFQFHKKLI